MNGTTGRIKVTYFLGENPYAEHINVDLKLDFIEACGTAMKAVQKANPTATDLIACEIKTAKQKRDERMS